MAAMNFIECIWQCLLLSTTLSLSNGKKWWFKETLVIHQLAVTKMTFSFF